MDNKTVFISADHGLAIVYFLQTDVYKSLQEGGAKIILLTDDSLIEQLNQRFGDKGVTFEGMRLAQVREYENVSARLQWWLAFLRRVGGSNKINTTAMDSYVDQVTIEVQPWQLPFLPLARGLVWLLRRFFESLFS